MEISWDHSASPRSCATLAPGPMRTRLCPSASSLSRKISLRMDVRTKKELRARCASSYVQVTDLMRFYLVGRLGLE